MSDETFYTIDFGVNYAKYNDEKLTKILKESWNAGVENILSISNNIKESRLNIEHGKKFSMVYFTLGIHPHNAKQYKIGDLDFIEKYLSHPKFFGIGECGLDYNRNFSPPEVQLTVFELQVKLAKKHNVKLYLHCRDAYQDFITILKKHQYYNGLVHCFTGNIEQAIELTQLGFKLGITGWIFDQRRNKDLILVIQDPRITLDQLIVETDAPYMPIFPAKESHPCDTGNIVEEIARLKKIEIIQCGKSIYHHSKDFLKS
jgi:TatD DNase family protein